MSPQLTAYLYSGTKNNFVLFDLRSAENIKAFKLHFKNQNRAILAKKLCKKHARSGGDGMVILLSSQKSDVKWDFYNADGSKAEMCGNASRCVGLHLTNGKRTKRPLKLETGSGIVEISVQNPNNIKVKMPRLKSKKLGQFFSVGHKRVNYDFVNTGVPHTLIELQNWQLGRPHLQLVKFIKSHKRFSPKSTNVTFWKKMSKNSIKALTFERGVKGYTQACGTGAVAAAFAFTKGRSAKKVQVHMPGGRLIIDLSGRQPILQGPARRTRTLHFLA